MSNEQTKLEGPLSGAAASPVSDGAMLLRTHKANRSFWFAGVKDCLRSGPCDRPNLSTIDRGVAVNEYLETSNS
jgi:hypothetical protein